MVYSFLHLSCRPKAALHLDLKLCSVIYFFPFFCGRFAERQRLSVCGVIGATDGVDFSLLRFMVRSQHGGVKGVLFLKKNS